MLWYVIATLFYTMIRAVVRQIAEGLVAGYVWRTMVCGTKGGLGLWGCGGVGCKVFCVLYGGFEMWGLLWWVLGGYGLGGCVTRGCVCGGIRGQVRTLGRDIFDWVSIFLAGEWWGDV